VRRVRRRGVCTVRAFEPVGDLLVSMGCACGRWPAGEVVRSVVRPQAVHVITPQGAAAVCVTEGRTAPVGGLPVCVPAWQWSLLPVATGCARRGSAERGEDADEMVRTDPSRNTDQGFL